MKTCRKGHEYPEGRFRQCPECQAESNRRRYKRDRDKRIAASIAYYQKHKDKKRENNKLYWARHPDKVLQHRETFKKKNVLYSIWTGIRDRCLNPKNSEFRNYGGRGITVAPEWLGRGGYQRFVADLPPRPSLNHTLDRINNDLGYSKDNCQWATRKQQGNNRRISAKVTICGRTQTKQEWARELGISVTGLNNRIRRGWTEEKLLQKPDSKFQTLMGRERQLEAAVIYLLGIIGDSVYERKFEIESLVGVNQESPFPKPLIV